LISCSAEPALSWLGPILEAVRHFAFFRSKTSFAFQWSMAGEITGVVARRDVLAGYLEAMAGLLPSF